MEPEVMEDENEWELRHDESSGQAYYVNLRTGESSWEAPELGALPADGRAHRQWTEAHDETGRLYYVNLETMETSWNLPFEFTTATARPPVSETMRRPSTAEQMDELNALLSGGDDDADGEDGGVQEAAASHAPHGEQGGEAVADGSEWMMFLNETDGVPYYYNHITGECVWEAPGSFLEYHAQHSGESGESTGTHTGDAMDEHGLNTDQASTSRRGTHTPSTTGGSLHPTPPAPVAPLPIPITPEFEEKVRRAVETVSKTPVGSSRLLFVRTPTVRALDDKSTGRSGSRPTSSSGSTRALPVSRPPSSSGSARASVRSRPPSASGSTCRPSLSRPTSSSGSTRQQMVAVNDTAAVDSESTEGQSTSPSKDDDLISENANQESEATAVEGEMECVDDVRIADDENARELQQREQMLRELLFDESALLIQCLVRCFLARRRVAHKRQERDEKINCVSVLEGFTASAPEVSMPIDSNTEATIPDESAGDECTNQSLTSEPENSATASDENLVDTSSQQERALSQELTPPEFVTTDNDKPVQETDPPKQVSVHENSLQEVEETKQQEVSPGDSEPPLAVATLKKAVSPNTDQATLASARRSVCSPQLRTSRRSEARAALPPREQHHSAVDTSSGRLAVLNITTYFPTPAPRNIGSPQVEPASFASHEAGIKRKSLSDHQPQLRASKTTEQRKEERVAREDTMSKRRAADEEERVEKANMYRQIYADSVVRSRTQMEQAREMEVKRQENARQTRVQRLREESAVPVVDRGNEQVVPTVWETLGRWGGNKEYVITEIKAQLNQVTLPDEFVQLMMRERLRSIILTTDRLAREKSRNKVNESVLYWQERVQSFPHSKSDSTGIQDPYWKRLQDSLQALVLSGKDIARLLTSYRTEDFDSLLHAAAWRGHVDVVEYIMTVLHADVNAVDSTATKTTPLHEAARGGHTQVVEVLLVHGASLDATNQHGDTALHIASRLGWSQVVHRLVAAGQAQDEWDSKSALIESTDATSRVRVLQTVSWRECFHWRNLQRHRAVDVTKLPSLVEFLTQYSRGLHDDHGEHARVPSASSSTGSTKRPKRTIKKKAKETKSTVKSM